MSKKDFGGKGTELTLRRNARERERVRSINDAFEHLRDRLPLVNRHLGKKASKYETLQAAIDYISQLQLSLSQAGLLESEPLDYMVRCVQSPESGFSSNASSTGGEVSPTKVLVPDQHMVPPLLGHHHHPPAPRSISPPNYSAKIEEVDVSYSHAAAAYYPQRTYLYQPVGTQIAYDK